MAWVAGVDGCKRGWVRVARETGTGELHAVVVATALELITRPPVPEVVAIDIPIGLTDGRPRACDERARKKLRARRSSVFPAPARPLLECSSHPEASALAKSLSIPGVSIQCFGILGKVREVDAFLASSPSARCAFREVHPEVSFCAWNGDSPMAASKKDAEGQRERARLVARWLGDAAFEDARASCRGAAADDVLDAFAALWTATRIASGEARTLPEQPPEDALGLPMQIVY